MSPKEQWLRYQFARRIAAGVLQDVVQGATTDFDAAVDAFESVALWRFAIGIGLRVPMATFGQMIEATEGWRMLDDGEGSHECG